MMLMIMYCLLPLQRGFSGAMVHRPKPELALAPAVCILSLK